MKKNRRKKDKGDQVTPEDKAEPTAKFQVGFFRFDDVKSQVDNAQGEAFQFLRDADVIIGGDSEVNRATFYGIEYMEEIANGKIDDTGQKKMAFVFITPEEFERHAVEFQQIVQHLKGSCCYGATLVDVFDAEGVSHAYMPPRFLFTRDGHVLINTQGDQQGMVLALTHETAKQYVDYLQSKQGIKVSIAEIGTIPGETLETQLTLSLNEGANCAFIIRSIDGESVICDIMRLQAKSKAP